MSGFGEHGKGRGVRQAAVVIAEIAVVSAKWPVVIVRTAVVSFKPP